jgi:uncharacterized protein (DUF433 family)
MLERIAFNPRIFGGKPIIKGTRISVEFILDLLATGMSTDEILGEYPRLSREDILAALDYAASTLANETIVVVSEPSESVL